MQYKPFTTITQGSLTPSLAVSAAVSTGCRAATSKVEGASASRRSMRQRPSAGSTEEV